jgi:hypothetical protein
LIYGRDSKIYEQVKNSSNKEINAYSAFYDLDDTLTKYAQNERDISAVQ